MRGGRKDGPEGGSVEGGPPRRELGRFHDAEADSRSEDSRDGLINQTINDRFEILDRIGSGGMGNVYIALDRSTNMKVAMKVLNEKTDRRYKWNARFSREAMAAGKINHPNVIDVLELGSFGDRRFCIMEYLEGEDLFKKLEREGRFPWEKAKIYLLQICDALEAAHSKSVIHRDMKPANVVVVNGHDYPLVKVLDFGLAKILDSEGDDITREGLIMGTPKYMAPEQAWGGKNYDHRADIYSLGAIMYEMLTGVPPFQSEAEGERERILQVLLMHKEQPPKPPRELNKAIPKDVEAVILRALSKDPDARFPSAREMGEAIMACPPKVKTAREAFPELFASREANGAVHQPAEEISPQPFPRMESAEETDRRTFEERLERVMESLPDMPKKRAGRLTKAVIILTAAAAGFAGYHYRSQLRDTYDSITRQEVQQAEPSRRHQNDIPQPPPSAMRTPAQPSASSATASTFEISVDSNPRGASVFDITGGANVFLGGTPLQMQVARGEHTLMIRHRGFNSQRKTINPDHPSLSVTLVRPPRLPQPVDSGEAGSTLDQKPAPSDTDGPGAPPPRE